MSLLNREIDELLESDAGSEYDSDPAAALWLLDRVADTGRFSAAEIGRDSDGATVRMLKLGAGRQIIQGKSCRPDKLMARCESIAIACRNALLSVRRR